MDGVEKLISYIEGEKVVYIGKISANEIIIDERVREYCVENKCGQYNKNFMCPPEVGEVKDFRKKLKKFDHCILVLKREKISNKEDREEYFRPARELHNILLNIEKKGKELGFENSFALIAGNCKLCNPCKKLLGYKKCPYPEVSRPSSESLGIDVIKTVSQIGVEIEFKDTEVSWVGMVII